jgi:hypothetical protein
MEKFMNISALCHDLALPAEVTAVITAYAQAGNQALDENIKLQLQNPATWSQAIEMLKERIGEDADGIYILAELLTYACETYGEYEKRGIERQIFVDTMKFCTRFIEEHKRLYGNYAFTWAWWFPRQITMKEFRIGALEYEFVNQESKQIQIHIPADADLSPESVQASFKAYERFLEQYYPQWKSVSWYCESWMLSPALFQLLPVTSNVLQFQKLFQIEAVDYDSEAVLDWVYPGKRVPLSELAENTTLQRNMKRFLLEGGKVGWAKGKIMIVSN